MQTIKPNKKMTQHKNLLLAIIVLVSFGMGIVSAFEDGVVDWRNLTGNLSTELIGGVITFYLIDQLILKNEDETSQRRSLISQLENHDNGIVKRVVQELRARGWLEDGSLYGWFLQKANFEGIYLQDASVNGLGLYRCNLTGAHITDDQFAQLHDLRFTIMPDGTMYDGRFCLTGDVDWAKSHYSIDFMRTSVQQMADYYGVSVEEFIVGQRWAKENLPKLGFELPPYLQQLSLDEPDRVNAK